MYPTLSPRRRLLGFVATNSTTRYEEAAGEISLLIAPQAHFVYGYVTKTPPFSSKIVS